jgi:hypothetical protein
MNYNSRYLLLTKLAYSNDTIDIQYKVWHIICKYVPSPLDLHKIKKQFYSANISDIYYHDIEV